MLDIGPDNIYGRHISYYCVKASADTTVNDKKLTTCLLLCYIYTLAICSGWYYVFVLSSVHPLNCLFFHLPVCLSDCLKYVCSSVTFVCLVCLSICLICEYLCPSVIFVCTCLQQRNLITYVVIDCKVYDSSNHITDLSCEGVQLDCSNLVDSCLSTCTCMTSLFNSKLEHAKLT